MVFVNDGNSSTKREAPPLALLLPFPSADTTDNTSTTSGQWLWYFYLTAWSRPFFAPKPSQRATHAGTARNNCIETTGLSFEKLLEAVKFPAAATIAAYEARWGLHPPTAGEVEAQAEDAAKTGSKCAYPPLPHVVESHFGCTLRTLAVHHHLLSLRANSSSASLEELVWEALVVVRPGVGEEAKIGATGGKAELMQNALRAMLSPDTTVEQHSLLLGVESTRSSNIDDDNDDDKMLQEEVHRACLFAALTVEVFGRVKKACVGLLLAFLNACSGRAAAARVCGVVMGIVEYAMAYRCHREDGAGRCLLNAAALLLCSLVDQQEEVAQQREEEVEEGEGEKRKSVVSGCLVATNIVTCIQDLLFALVAGGAPSPHRAPHPPTRGMAKQKTRSGEQQMRSPEIFVRPVAARALTLHEADALLGVFFPALLQQMGFEWPWSESLRRAQQLEKVQQEGVSMFDGVRLNSRTVFEEVLSAISRRTYLARLQNILPQSYELLLSSIFFRETRNGNDDKAEGDDGGGYGQRRLFVMPVYYRAAGEALVEFFERSGLGMTTARETEQVLLRNTDVQPMIVQLQALGGSPDVSEVHDGQDSYLNDATDLLRTACLSEDEKLRLLLRYRCEVLLASLIVYTQLQTVSVVQQLTRQLAPLFEKLLLPLMHERTLRRPFVVSRKRHSANGNGLTEEMPINLTPEFRVLMDDIHYEFYPLEWIPEVLDEYLQRHSLDSDTAFPASYSVFAAVAYQFGLVLQGNPQGLRGGDGTDCAVRVKAYRFFQTLLLNSLADTVMSSCELEGAMAVAMTRRVGRSRQNLTGGNSNNNNGNNGNNDNNEGDQAQVLQCGATSFHAVVNPHDAVFALAQCLLPPELTSRPRVTATAADANHRMSDEWLRCVVEWGRSTKAQWTLRRQQQRVAPTSTLTSHYNSLTFDSVPLAREVIRGLRQRLLEKMHVKTALGVERGASPDPLLRQHLLSLQVFLQNVGLLQPHSSSDSDAPVLSAANLLWSSPLFSNELRLSGRYDAGE